VTLKRGEVVMYQADVDRLDRQIEALTEQRDALAEALKAYMAHAYACESTPGSIGCQCTLCQAANAALKAASREG
jgi:hypothetical protein